MGTFFIDRPVFAAVISIIIVLLGLMAYRIIPVTQYPDIGPPTVSVSASYPGATAEVVANTVAAPLEEELNGLEGVMYMTSSSTSTGGMTLTLTFEPGTDPNLAQVNVQNRVNQKLQALPEVVRTRVTVEKKSGNYLMIIAVTAPEERYDPLYLGTYTNLYLLDPIKRIPGASNAAMLPPPDLAMRVWLQPEELARLAIPPTEVIAAIQAQNQAYGVGTIGQPPAPPGTEQSFAVSTQGMLNDPAEFGDIIVRAASEGTGLVRLKDLARVELGVRDYGMVTRLNGQRAAAIAIFQQAGTNAIAVSQQVRERLATLRPNFPAGIDYQIVLDTSTFTQASIAQVLDTFRDAVILVVLVVFLFLQSLRATLIPVLAIPIAIIGTFVGILLLGFSLNMLTLFGLILAIGLVVDDAIIVVEDVEKNMARHGLSAKDATRQAMGELTGALVTIALVLGAVFLPVAFITGMTGTLYQQFAVTIAIAMVLSGVVALSLSPALAARLLRPAQGEKKPFFRGFERAFAGLTAGYLVGVRWLLAHRLISIGLFAGTLAALAALLWTIPGGFVPDEDQGYLGTFNILPDAASLERTMRVSEEILPLLQANPVVDEILQIDGLGTASQGQSYLLLRPYEERRAAGMDAASLAEDLQGRLASIKAAQVIVLKPPAIPDLGGLNGFAFYIQSKGAGTPQELEEVVQDFLAAARQRPELVGLDSRFSASQQQIYIDVDRERAELLGVKVESIYQTLQAYFGSVEAGNFIQNGRISRVILQADAEYRDKPDDLTRVFVRSATTQAVMPLSAVASIRYATGPGELPHYNGFPAATVNGFKAPGYSSGQAIATMEAVALRVLPAGYAFDWGGQEREEKQSGTTSLWAFAMGLTLVFLILAALYENWSLPIGVVLAVPFALCGALVFIWGLGMDNNVYVHVGLLTLVGLSAKNAILIIQFAAEHHRAGMEPVAAAIEAARQRFRPIVMTSLAFILGGIPLALASGAGANSQHAIGIGIIGGMLASTLVASLFVPLFFVLLEEASQRVRALVRAPARPSSGWRNRRTCA